MKKKMYVEPSLQVVKMGAVVLQSGSPEKVTETMNYSGDDNGGGEGGIDAE
jgi:hypothetical protein